jgi:hypothetical protein
MAKRRQAYGGFKKDMARILETDAMNGVRRLNQSKPTASPAKGPDHAPLAPAKALRTPFLPDQPSRQRQSFRL